MADGTKIEWTDATWNIITGCSIKSPGCSFCYAMKLAGTRLKHHPSRAGLTIDTKNGPVWNGLLRFNEQWLLQPLQWAKPRMIFPCAHGDLFHENVIDAWLDPIYAVMALAEQHTFQVLTKRPDNMLRYLADPQTTEGIDEHCDRLAPAHWCKRELQDYGGLPLRNAWLGTSVENQEWADKRREPMRRLAELGWRTWVSYEPALGAVDWTGWKFLTWMVSGGESGAYARPSHPDWHRRARDWCAMHRIPYHLKQRGAWIEFYDRDREDPDWCKVPSVDGQMRPGAERFVNLEGGFGFHGDRVIAMRHVGKAKAGRALDGVIHDAFPTFEQQLS